MRWRQLQTAQPHINLPSLVHCPDLAGLAETEADQPGPAQLVGVQSAPLPSPGLEVNTPALCQHPQVARHHGDLVQLLARGREHGYQGLPADIQLEERLSPACQLEQEVARVGLLPSCVEPGLARLEPGADQGGDVQPGPEEGGDGVEVGEEGGGDSTAGPQSAGREEDGAGERMTEAGGRREEVR